MSHDASGSQHPIQNPGDDEKQQVTFKVVDGPSPLAAEKSSDVSSKTGPSKKRWWLMVLKEQLDVESRGIVPTPPEERTDTAYQKIFFIWLSANCNILSCVSMSFPVCIICIHDMCLERRFSAGTVGPILFRLSFRHSAAVIAGFTLLGSILPALFSIFGPKLGMRQMVQSRYSWGCVKELFDPILSSRF